LDLSSNSIGGYYPPDAQSEDDFISTPEGPKAIAEVLKVTPSLTSLSLGDNNLGDDGVEALSVGLKESKSLATLNLHDEDPFSTNFGPKGAAALASAIAFMASLTEVR